MTEILQSSETLQQITAQVGETHQALQAVITRTPLQYSEALSAQYQCKIYLKREDLQVVRSYKVRGGYNFIRNLSDEQRAKGIVCASTGNHAQGVAYTCKFLGIRGRIYMPTTTPKQKLYRVQLCGGDAVEIQLVGDTFDDCLKIALAYSQAEDLAFVPPFDHPQIIAGQATIGKEIWEDLPETEYVFVPIGGGGLSAGIGAYLKSQNPNIKVFGVEPFGSPTMKHAFEARQPVEIKLTDKFADGVAVKKAGVLTYQICREVLKDIVLVPEGKVCTTMLDFYNRDAIVLEPAGALSVSALDTVAEQIKGKTVVCILSGGNNDIDRLHEIKERSMLYEGLKYYFVVQFAQRPGALKYFVNEILGVNDNITRFEYIQRHNKESGPALVGIELKNSRDYDALISRMNESHISFIPLNENQTLFEFLV
jgi:threonine dehydratase